MNKTDTIAIIRSLLSSTKCSYSIYKLNRDFKNETGIDIPLFGYNNISDFLQSLTDTVKVTGIYPVQQVSLVFNEKSAHIISLVQRQKNANQRKKLSPRINFGSRKSSLDTNRCKEVHKHQLLLKKTIKDDYKKQSAKSANDVFSLETKLFLEKADHTNSSDCNFGDIAVQNFLVMEESPPYIDLGYHAQVGEYVEVCPCKIFSPYKFYFQFRKFKKKFSTFTKKLQIFYNTYDEIPNLTYEVLQPKLICAVFYETYNKSMWHRVEIQEILKGSQALVNFIDDGGTAIISKENLKYLHKNFISFPRQACLGSLASIKPSKGDLNWSSSAIKRFYDLTFQKDLVGGVIYLNPENSCMKMTLSDTNGVEIHINDTLVTEGYAEFNKDVVDSSVAVNLKNCTSTTATGSQSKKEISNEMANIFSEFRTRVFYLSSNYCNNKKLKNLFSVVEET